MVRASILILILFSSAFSRAQNNSYKSWMIKEILKRKDFVGNIHSHTMAGLDHFYWPGELNKITHALNDNGDHLFKTKDGIFTVIEGTGRIYQIKPDDNSKSGLSFIRIDSTYYSGYNIGASVFYNNDTLYSVGGYGLWNFSWHLRYFRASSHGWEVLPVNRMLRHQHHSSYVFLDEINRNFYSFFDEFFNEGLKSSNQKVLNNKYPKDTIYLERLNLNSKNWERLGIMDKDALKLINSTTFIGNIPWGKVMSASDRYENKCYLINYHQNRIFELKDRKLGSHLRDAAHSGIVNSIPSERRLIYYHDDSIHYMNSNKEAFAFKLTIDDFKETPMKIWQPLPEKVFEITNPGSKIFFGLGVITFMTGLWFYFRSSKKENGLNGNLFTKQEAEVLKCFTKNPEMAIMPDDVDEIIGTEGRSMEAMKKRRSMIIRSINGKFSDHFDNEDELIRTERLESDRRMVKYVVDPQNYSKVQKLIIS